jgi:hypothetical protein
MALHDSGVSRPFSVGSAQMLFGVIKRVGCVDKVQVAFPLRRNLHLVNSQHSVRITSLFGQVSHPPFSKQLPLQIHVEDNDRTGKNMR